MSLRFVTSIVLSSVLGLFVAWTAMPAQAAPDSGVSPALCGPTDLPEPGIQGEVPAGQTANYNCGLRLISQLPRVGTLQAAGQCVYVRSGNSVFVVDVSDPVNPVEVTSVPVQSGSETMRVVVTPERSILVSGSSVYDISNCLSPVLKGEIAWPNVKLAGIPTRLLPNDIGVNRAGTRVYASSGLWEADITNLNDPTTWTVTDHRCDLAAQQPGPWSPVHTASLNAGLSLCVDATRPAPLGANYTLGASAVQAALLWRSLSHTIETNATDTRVYVGDQAGGTSANFAPVAKVRIIDLTQSPRRIIAEVDGPGHGMDWFRIANGREFVLHSNEGGSTGIPGQAAGGDPCQPFPRPFSLSWGFEAFLSEVTGDVATRVGMLQIAINKPEFCQIRQASGRDPSVAHHVVDNPL